MTTEQVSIELKKFEDALDKLINIACDWRLAWDGSGLSPEAKIQRAKGKVMQLYREAIP